MLFSSHRILLDNKQFCFVPLLMVTWLRMCLSRLSAIQFFYFGQLIFCGEVLWEFACISLVIKLSIYTFIVLCCCSVAQPCLTICDPTECSTPSFPSPSPGAGSNSCPLSRWCHPAISSSVVPFSSCLQSFPASPGKNTGVGCHFLLQCMKVKSEIEVAQSCPTLSDPMDCGPPGSSIHGIFQARVLEWGAIAFSDS